MMVRSPTESGRPGSGNAESTLHCMRTDGPYVHVHVTGNCKLAAHAHYGSYTAVVADSDVKLRDCSNTICTSVYRRVQMAKCLGCDAVSVRIRQWLAGGLSNMFSDRSKSGDENAIAWRQVQHSMFIPRTGFPTANVGLQM